MLLGTIDFCYTNIPLSVTLTLTGFTSSAQSETCLHHSLAHVLTEWYEMWKSDEHLETTVEWDYWIKGNNCCCIDCTKDLNIGLHLDIYEPIWFKLDMMTDATKLYILIIVYVTWTVIQGHRDTKKQTLLCQLSSKDVNEFGWNLVCCWDLLIWWIWYSFYLVWWIFKGDNSGDMIIKKTKNRTIPSSPLPIPLTLVCIPTFTDWFLTVSCFVCWQTLLNCII